MLCVCNRVIHSPDCHGWYQALQYYLADDTVEIREKHAANSGRDHVSLLMSRQRVPLEIKTPGACGVFGRVGSSVLTCLLAAGR